MNKITVYEVKIKLFLLKNIAAENSSSVISSFIDHSLAKDKEFLDYHNKNAFKLYTFNSLYPICEDKIYKKDNIYTLIIRTTSSKLANFFYEKLVNEYDENIKALNAEVRVIPRRLIEKVYSITPVIVKTDSGYWKDNLSFEEFENRLKINLIKKYNQLMNTKINEDFPLYTSIEITNKKPIAIPYKNIKLLGDKVTLHVESNKMAQELTYMALGTGILEMNSRGLGFVNYKFL